jgi:hypothetical protein
MTQEEAKGEKSQSEDGKAESRQLGSVCLYGGSASAVLRRNLLIHGAGGLIAPFIGIKRFDLLLVARRLV